MSQPAKADPFRQDADAARGQLDLALWHVSAAEKNRTLRDLALHALDRLVIAGGEITSDDLWEGIDEIAELDPKLRRLCVEADGRVLGAVLREAGREGRIRATGRYRVSKRVACHGRPVRVWSVVTPD